MSDIAEGILIVVILFIALLFLGFFLQWLSNISGFRLRTRFGTTIAEPDDYEKTKEALKSLTRNRTEEKKKENILGQVDLAVMEIYNKIAASSELKFSQRLQDRKEFTNDRLMIVKLLIRKEIITEREGDILTAEVLRTRNDYKWEPITNEKGQVVKKI